MTTELMESAIRHPDRAKQVIDYGGIRCGNIMPTDLDGIIEYKGKAYILIEMKHRDTKIPTGQRIALERMVDDFKLRGKLACLLLCSHCVDNCDDVIRAEYTIVTGIYYNFRWTKWYEPLGDVINKIIRRLENEERDV